MLKVSGLVVAFVSLTAGPVWAVQPEPVQFALLGIGQGQTLRLNAVAKDPGPIGCEAILSFADRNGTVLSNPGPTQISLAPGQAAFLDVASGLAGIGRFEARPVVEFTATGGTNCVFDVEVFDQASGYSSVAKNPGPSQGPGEDSTFSLLGLGFAQIAQINAVWKNPGPIQAPTAAVVDAGPCIVTLGFVDAAGSSLGANSGPQQIGPGQTASHYFLALPPTIGPRVNVRPIVTVDSVAGMPACPGVVPAVVTFDVFTGRTWDIAIDKQPGPIQFSLLGVGRGQTLRLNAVAKNPGPVGCDAILKFADRNGAPVGPAPLSVSLPPGHAAFLDVPSGLTGAGRFEAQPVVTFPAAGGGTECAFGVEIFDQASGYSSVEKNPGPTQLPDDALTFSLLGLGFGQIAQINAVWKNPGPINGPTAGAVVDAGPCVATLGFVDAAGAPVGSQPGPTQIGPGQIASHYFLALPPTIGPRVNVRPVVAVGSVPGMPACPGVVSVVETFDVFTGRTWLLKNPGPVQ